MRKERLRLHSTMEGIREPFLKYLVVLALISGSCGTNTTTVSPTFSRTSTNRLQANVSTPQQQVPTEAKEIAEFVTETVDYTEIPENGDSTADTVNEAIQTTQLSDTGVVQTSKISSVSPSSVNKVVTTQTTVSTATTSVFSQRVPTSPTPLLQSITSPFVEAQNENSPTVTSGRKPTTLSFDFTTRTTTRSASQRSESTDSRTFLASADVTEGSVTVLPTSLNYMTSKRPTSDGVTELLMRAMSNESLTTRVSTKTSFSTNRTQAGVSQTIISPSITETGSTVSPSRSSTSSIRSTSVPLPNTSRNLTTSSPGTSYSPSSSRSQITLPPSTSKINTTSSSSFRTSKTPTLTPTLGIQTTSLPPSTRSITTTKATLPSTALSASTTQSDQWSSSATPKRTSPTFLISTKTIILPNTTPNRSTSTHYLSTSESELIETTATGAESTRNITIIYVDDDTAEKDDLPLLLIVIAATVAGLVTLLLIVFLAILCIAKKREERKNAKYYDYKKRWVKRAPRPKYEKVKQNNRHDREAAGSGWVFRDGADPSKQITLELRPRDNRTPPEDITDNVNPNRRHFGNSFPPDMLSASPEVAVNLDADSIGSLRLSKSLDRTDTRSNSSEGDSGILALGDDTWSPTKGVPFHFISDDAVIEL